MRNKKKITLENIFVLYIVGKKLLSFCNILTLSKAFDSTPDFENLGYQVEIIILFKKFQRLHTLITFKSIPT